MLDGIRGSPLTQRRPRGAALLAVTLASALWIPSAASSQALPPATADATVLPVIPVLPSFAVPLSPQSSPAGQDGPAAAAVRSLVLPGWGQWHLGQKRAWAYFFVEAGAWAVHLELEASGRHYRTLYRDQAWNTGRVQTGARVEGPWAYYEAMTHWTRSGAFDADPNAAGVQPEEDPTTFNGAKWALARGIFFSGGTTPPTSDPAYQAALAYYEQHAYGTPYLWDWTGKAGALAEYRHLINRSDARFREASATLGAVLANHLLSAVDAYVSARGGPRTGLRVAPQAGPAGLRWTLSAHMVTPR